MILTVERYNSCKSNFYLNNSLYQVKIDKLYISAHDIIIMILKVK